MVMGELDRTSVRSARVFEQGTMRSVGSLSRRSSFEGECVFIHCLYESICSGVAGLVLPEIDADVDRWRW